MKLQPKLTPARRLWLERLRDQGPCHRHGGRTGFDCMQLKWTEWAYVDKEMGQPITWAEARQRWPDEPWDHVDCVGEELTEAGRKILEES